MKKIYLVHGWSYTPQKWQSVKALLSKGNIEMEVFDVPGLDTELDTPWTLDDYVEWLHKELKDKKNIILAGHSNGGRIALAYTLKYPENIAKLILIDAAGIAPKGFKIKLKRVIFGTAAKLGKKFTNSQKARTLLYKVAREKDYNEASPVMKQTLVNLISVNLEEKISQICTPTLLVWGRNDKLTPLKDGLLMNKKIAGSEIKIIENCGHSPHITNVEKLSLIISESLK